MEAELVYQMTWLDGFLMFCLMSTIMLYLKGFDDDNDNDKMA